MKFFKGSLMIILFLVFLVGIGNAFASDLNDFNSTMEQKNEIIDDNPIFHQSNEIEVETWEDIQYYASLNDKNYVLKLKENTNYYPKNVASTDNQIIFNNNLTVIGSEGAYIGDSSDNPRSIAYTAMKVPDDCGVGITFKNVTFKWIGTRYQPDGLFLVMGGNSVNYFEDCLFTNISTNFGHSAILQIRLGDLVVKNCSFINCTNDYGCLSVFNPDDNPSGLCTRARMNVTDSYFEGNYARTAPGCINNCGILVVRNSTFYRNSAFWWAGAIHTTGGANTTLYDSRFIDNVAGWNGGALYTYSYLQIFNTTFINNNCTTSNGGGAIGACKYQHAPYIYVQDSFFQNNENTCWALSEVSSGTGRGGAISIMDEGGLEVRNTTFIKNSASHGTAICAISAGAYGSPDVVIVGNRFINHTRVGDVLDIRLASSSYCEIKDNYYYNNSFEFKKLKLVSDENVGDDVLIHIDAELKNPESFESDILDAASYDIYVDGIFNKTVTGRNFTLNLNGRTCNVYVVPVMSNSVSDEILVGVPKEYIYVSKKSGNDANDGLVRSTPVNTLTKAVEIAKTKGNIVIMDGTFTETGIVIDYDLNIIGEDNVKFTGSSASTLFTVSNGSDFSISNIAFEGLVFTAKDAGIIRQNSGFTVIDSCLFNDNYVSGLTGCVLIESKNIEVYNSNFTNNNKKYVMLIKSDDFLIDGCIFSNNIASYTSHYSLITTAGEKTGVKGEIYDSIFESNTVKNGCIYFGASNAPLTISNTKFIANKVGSNNDHSSCIKIETSPVLRIMSSVFMDNVDLGSKSAVIYVSGNYPSVFVADSIILNNSYQNTFNLVFSASTSSNLNVYKNLDGNWWGNTWENYTVVPPVHASACSNWLVLNMTSNATDLAVNQKALVSVDFFNAADRHGNLSFHDAGKLPEFALDAEAVNGTLGSSEVNVIKGSGTLEYTMESLIRGEVTVKYKNVHSTLKFDWGLIDADISINVDNVAYGNRTEIIITAPSDIDENKMVLTINDVGYAFNKTVMIPKLDVGTYSINLTYSGDDKYIQNSYEKVFEVVKASPQFGIDVGDAYYGSPVGITLTTDEDVTGDVSIKIDEIFDKKEIVGGKVEFTVENLTADSYAVEICYGGNKNYLPKNLTSNFSVRKYDSTITISKGNVEIGKDVVLIFTVNQDASGYITVNVNGKKENVTVLNGTATYMINNISKGLYVIEAVYSGDVKYLSSLNATQIDIGRLNATLYVNVENITYGETANFVVILDNDTSGNVTISIDGKNYAASVNDGRASLNISDLTAGVKIANVEYSGDFMHLPCQAVTSFSIAKAKPAVTIDAQDIKEGKSLNVQITITKGATGTLQIILPDESENAEIPRTGVFTRSVSDLGVGNYVISAIYAGDENYLEVNTTKTVHVTAWETPQWPNEGYATANNQKSPYTSEANGNVAWVSDINGDIIGNMAIDSLGNIYIATSEGIYSINSSDGSKNWIFKSNDAGDNFTGVAIGRDMILSPKSGHKLFIINQTTGVALNNNIFQASSYFSPIVDENANIYITSEYQTTTSSYNLVIVPYDIWEFSTTPVLINIGKSAPTTAPVLLNDNTVAIATEDSLKMVDIASRSVTNSFKITTYVRPVVSDNILYAISDNDVVAITPAGSMWKVAINGTAGGHLSVGENGEIFSITKEGVLHEYSTGNEIFVYDFKNSVSQAVLVGQNDVLYVGCENGEFCSIDIGGNLLWKVNLNETLSGLPVMDKNGVIYVISGNRIVAINKGIFNDSNSSVKITPSVGISASDIRYGETLQLKVNLNRDATGNVTVDVANISQIGKIIGGIVEFEIHNITCGQHEIIVRYEGDEKYLESQNSTIINVFKAEIPVSEDILPQSDDLTNYVINLPIDATGTFTVSVDGKNYTVDVVEGKANISIPQLNGGSHSISLIYSGDDNYSPIVESKVVVVPIVKLTGNDVSMLYTSGAYYKAYLTQDGSPLVGETVYITINGKTYSRTTDNNGYASFKVSLPPKTYAVTAAYGKLNVTNKVIVKSIIKANNVNAKKSAKSIKIKISLKQVNKKYLKGKPITLKFNKKTFKAKTNKKGIATFTIKNSVYKKLKVGKKYTYQVIISKDTIKKTIKFK